ncbi:MAG: indolepyruvate ferredoxin oxidoreductase subunit alpha [Treponema sp.]|nr:indolepyruvate ferredoxin oxidoreductase subunit alpha [Treponema sp.]
MKQLMTGNEAIARGAWEAGVFFASAYPGTPSTEILQNLTTYKEIDAEWAPNEKVAMEAAIGASIGGARAMASMKHVGVNVASDPLHTFSYTGVNGGMVLVGADEPGQHSSQNEQDNRWVAKMAKIPMLEPSDSQECKDMMGIGFEISEKYDTPVFFRVTTRICHSKSIVECGDRTEVGVKEYVKQTEKYVTVPLFARKRRVIVENRMEELLKYSESTPLNRIEKGNGEIGVIACGVCYQYAKEIFGDEASYLKLGFTSPLPKQKIKEFCEQVKTVYVIEENDPYIEETVLMLGFEAKLKGKNVLPKYGELMPDVLRKSIYGKNNKTIDYDRSKILPRPPTLCAGCPHRGFFYDIGRRKNIVITGDIGCYSLGYAEPYNAMDSNVCMGAAFSAAHGTQKIFSGPGKNEKRVVGVMGDSTFFHTGMNSLLEVVYNNSKTICVILDNAITGMTGHQNTPGNGLNARGEPANVTSIEAVVRALGIKNVTTVDPNDLTKMKEAMDWALSLDEPSVIITRFPCVLKRITKEEKVEFNNPFTSKSKVNTEKCVGCKLCLRSGCPALSFETASKKAKIASVQCVGCTVCNQICPKQAIEKEGK